MAGRAGAKKVEGVEGRQSKLVCDWPTRDTELLAGWAGYCFCCCFPSPHAFPNQGHPVYDWRPVLFLTVGLFLLSVARSLEELADKLQYAILKVLSCPTILPPPTLLCTIHGLAEAFVCQQGLVSMGASWSSLRWQSWAWGTVNGNIRTTRRSAQGQTANARVVNVEETLAKLSLDLQIPGAVLLSSHAGVVHLLLPLPMAMIRWMEEWERVLLSHPGGICACCRVGLVHCNLLLP